MAKSLPSTIDRFPLVRVDWEDARGVNNAWQYLEEAQPRPAMISSVGFLACQDKRSVMLVPHVSMHTQTSDEQYCGDMTIPRSAIRRLRKLR